MDALLALVAIQRRGPVMQVTVSIEQNADKGLLAQGKTVVTKSGLALIDTGASNTCIDEQAAEELGLPVMDVELCSPHHTRSTLARSIPFKESRR